MGQRARVRSTSLPLVVVAVVALASGGCTTFNSARPLATGEHAVNVSVGGPLTNVPGVATIPLPNVTVEGRHGLKPIFGRPLDVNYGLHLLPLAFGVPGAHVGAGVLVVDEDGGIPAVSVGQRFFFFTNVFDFTKSRHDGVLLSQTDVTASYTLFEQLVYGGLSLYAPVEIESAALHAAPVLGVQLQAPRAWDIVPGLRLQVETRWLSPTTDQRFAVVDWVGLPTGGGSDFGAFAVNVGVGYVFGGAQ